MLLALRSRIVSSLFSVKPDEVVDLQAEVHTGASLWTSIGATSSSRPLMKHAV